MKKATIIVLILITLLGVGYCLVRCIMPALYLGGILPPAPSYKKIEKIFNDGIDELSYVTDSLLKSDYDYIAIRKTDGSANMYAANDVYYMGIRQGSEGADIPIIDQTLAANIEKLYKNGIEAIFYHRDSYIEFSMWSSLDENRGIARAINREEPNIEFLSTLKSLPENDWYYYETNFNVWRSRNRVEQ